MPRDASANQRLAEILLGRPLEDYVTEKRHSVPRWPWRLIADQLAADTHGQVAVTHETLRTWFGTADDDALVGGDAA